MGETPRIDKQPFLLRALRKTLNPERATEFLSAQLMMQLEIVHDMQLYPDKWGMTPDQTGRFMVPDNPPMAKWAMDHIGDIWEISAGFTAMRLGFVAANEVLKKEPIKKLTHGYQVSDEAAFWASLMTTWTVKAIHSMGWISIFHIHDHMNNPVPEMIFGQGVAAVVLAASHYSAKYREPIKNLVLRVARLTGRKFKEFDAMLSDVSDTRNTDVTREVAVNVAKSSQDKEGQ